jgi:hypothetical protein
MTPEPDPADLEMQEMPLDEVLADIAWNTGEPDICRSHPDGCVNYPDTDWCGSRTAADFPADFQGAGPMYAAVTLGTAWLNAATSGATTYILENPYPSDPQLTDEQANAAHYEYAGNSAFLDRAQVEQLADHPGRHGTFVRYEGLTGWNDWTATADAKFRQADEEMTAFLDSLPEAGS